MLALDVTSDASVEAAVGEVMRLDGRIDLLVNNAGFGVAPAGAEESSIEQARAIFETNFFGIVRIAHRQASPRAQFQGALNVGNSEVDDEIQSTARSKDMLNNFDPSGLSGEEDDIQSIARIKDR